MKTFNQLRENPLQIDISQLIDKKEIIFTCVTPNSNSLLYVWFKKNNDEFHMQVRSSAWNQLDCTVLKTPTLKIFIEWNADINCWDEVIQQIQAGPQMIAEWKARA